MKRNSRHTLNWNSKSTILCQSVHVIQVIMIVIRTIVKQRKGGSTLTLVHIL